MAASRESYIYKDTLIRTCSFRKLDADGNVEAACNGCLNTEGMNVRFDHHEKHGPCQSDTTAVSHHNGLGPTIEILEKIYRDPTFPPRTPEMETSLFDQGISRADLWAFATISAVEYGIDMHNIMCEDPTHLAALDTHNYPYDSGTSSSHFHYNIHYGETECKVLTKYSQTHASSLVSDSKTELQVHNWSK